MSAEKVISSQELAKHDTAADAWVAIHGNVYNITPWLDRHPGGRDILNQTYGKEISDLFDSYHFASANGVLGTEKVPKIGKYVPDAADVIPTYASSSPFYDECREKVSAYIRENKTGERTLTIARIIDSAIIISGIIIFLHLALFSSRLWLPLRFLCAIVTGVLSHLYLTHIAHDVGHVSYSRSHLVWRYMRHATDFLSGHSLLMWIYRHNLGHHLYTNVSEADPDISKYQNVSGDKMIYKSPLTTFPQMCRPFIYLLTTAFMKVEDVLAMITGKFGIITINKPEFEEVVVFWAAKAFFILYRIVLPTILLSQSWILSLLLFMTIEGASGLVFGVMSQMNHVTLDREWPEAHNNKDWAKLQVLTCINYCNDSYFWTYMSGYLNFQVEHHLFPAINPHLYPKIAPIIKQICAAHKVEYTHKNSGWQAITDHFAQLELFSSKLPQ